ncbi:hypothetical protein MRB53_027332 [Persea americana]|uniref:Uncharacterized protein n=1 Tax=Persea americana TaxID=3435 RepID=A0ACC2LLV7_PERAE|nr:hypothetical protein MRB53_027332 [Persea americana]
MVSRATNYWKAMLSRTGVSRGFSTTAPKMKTLAEPKPIKGEMVPVYMTAIMVVIVFAIAGHTAKQQMVHAPSVHFNKKRRGTMPEVELPDSVASNGQKFISKSFLRKVAHLKDREDVISNPIEGNLIKSPKNVESVKSVGVSPKDH